MKHLFVSLCACMLALAVPLAPAQERHTTPTAGLTVSGAWLRWVPGTQVASAYFELRNDGKRTVAVTAVESPAAEHAMLHESFIENGQSRMRHVEKIEIAPARTVRLEPGGLHVMLHGLREGIAVGQSVPLTLTLSTGENLRFTAEVRPLGAQ